jgi:hypothetical protein
LKNDRYNHSGYARFEGFYDLRDRAAYVHVTGAMPTHLRTYMSELLNKISRSRVLGRQLD